MKRFKIIGMAEDNGKRIPLISDIQLWGGKRYARVVISWKDLEKEMMIKI